MSLPTTMPQSLPKHLAIIMDGNGRWASKRFLPRVFGHRAGVETVRKVVKYCSDVGVGFLTLYAFSTENWSRPATEVGFLLSLFRIFIEKEKKFLHANNVVVRFIGQRQALPGDIQEMMLDMENFTTNNTGLTLVLAINYGGKTEIIDAIKRVCQQRQQDMHHLSDEALNQALSENMYLKDIPPPDLLIRTAGEKRISNFLLWHIAYTELYFSDKFWPDFDENDLNSALTDFMSRERRYGGVVSQ